MNSLKKIITEEIYNLYHGTEYKFDKFSLRYFNAGSGDGGWLGYGLYFTNDIDYAESYGDVIKAKIDINNSYNLNDPSYSRSPNKLANELGVITSREVTAKLKSMGYDSVKLQYNDIDVDGGIFIELCVFDPNKIVNFKYLE